LASMAFFVLTTGMGQEKPRTSISVIILLLL
jgi:hypothetical protein